MSTEDSLTSDKEGPLHHHGLKRHQWTPPNARALSISTITDRRTIFIFHLDQGEKPLLGDDGMAAGE